MIDAHAAVSRIDEPEHLDASKRVVESAQFDGIGLVLAADHLDHQVGNGSQRSLRNRAEWPAVLGDVRNRWRANPSGGVRKDSVWAASQYLTALLPREGSDASQDGRRHQAGGDVVVTLLQGAFPRGARLGLVHVWCSHFP